MSGLVAGATLGAIVGINVGTIVGEINEWFLSLNPKMTLLISFVLVALIIFLAFALFLKVYENKRQKLPAFSYNILAILASSLVFPFILYFSLKVLSPISSGKLSLGFIIHSIYLPVFLIPVFIFNSILQPFLRASSQEKSRWEWVSSYPNLFCPTHLCRTRKIRLALLYNDVRCKVDECSHKRFYKAKRVIGVIGGKRGLTRGRYNVYVLLWRKEHAINAEIDELQIRQSTDMNKDDYDRAVDMVVNALSNNPDLRLKDIKVGILGNPPLSARAERLLEDTFKEIHLRKLKRS